MCGASYQRNVCFGRHCTWQPSVIVNVSVSVTSCISVAALSVSHRYAFYVNYMSPQCQLCNYFDSELSVVSVFHKSTELHIHARTDMHTQAETCLVSLLQISDVAVTVTFVRFCIMMCRS